jgi:glutamate synthase (NADPH/NADH) small chain
MPKRLKKSGGRVTGIEFEYTVTRDGRLVGTGETFALDADMVFKAIGQTFVPAALLPRKAGEGDHAEHGGGGAAETIALEAGRIRVDAERRTSLADVWAGGDCVAGGKDLTVVAVEDGKIAAESINRALMG